MVTIKNPVPAYIAIAEQKRAERLAKIPKGWRLQDEITASITPWFWTTLPKDKVPTERVDVRNIVAESHILTPKELSITSDFDVTDLAEEIRAGNFSAEEVTVAFCKRAAIAQQVCNCLTEIIFDEAIARSRWLDQEFQRTGRPVGPLHGIPISIKDCLKIKGYDASTGLAALVNKPANENSVLVDILLDAGAVLYVKTNVSQLMLAADSVNHVFGRTLNPRNRAVTAGGSSGGEGALIAMRGSLLGIGTDSGGSIRIPAMCNGIYGIKPSANRLPFSGQTRVAPAGLMSIGSAPSAGPLATTLRDCELLMKVVAGASPWLKDATCLYGPWNCQGELPSLKPSTNDDKFAIGIFRNTHGFMTLPPITNVMNETAQALEKAGHKTVELCPPEYQALRSLINDMLGIAGSKWSHELLDKTGEPPTPWLVGKLGDAEPLNDLEKLCDLNERRTKLQTMLLEMWKDPDTGKELDAIVVPVASHPPPRHDQWSTFLYTISFVTLDWPGGVLPVRDITEDDLRGDLVSPDINIYDPHDKEWWDSPETRSKFLDTKLCVQVVVPRLQDRRLIQAMEVVESSLRATGVMG